MALFSTFLDYTKICRLCLSQDHPLRLIYSGNNAIVLQLKIAECVGIEVKTGDNMPDKICSRCLEQLQNWMKFKELCMNANTTLLLQSATEINDTEKVSSLTLKRHDYQDIPENSVDFSFVDVNSMETDSLFQSNLKLVDFQSPFLVNPKSLEDNRLTSQNQVNGSMSVSEREEQKGKWREKYSNVYMKKYNCDICTKHFSKFNDLLKHDKTEHKEVDFNEKCSKCGHNFISVPRLDLHDFIKHRNKSYECDVCGLKCVTEKSLKVHKLKHSKKFKCEICNATHSSKASLLEHMLSHKKEKDFTCDICLRKFKHKKSLIRHEHSHNPNQNSRPNFKCDICYRLFSTLELLQQHKESHSSGKLICELCGLEFKNKMTLSIHKLSHNPKKHTCELCDRAFTTKNLVARHILTTHSEKRYPCLVCNKTYKRLDTLKLHRKSHICT